MPRALAATLGATTPKQATTANARAAVRRILRLARTNGIYATPHQSAGIRESFADARLGPVDLCRALLAFTGTRSRPICRLPPKRLPGCRRRLGRTGRRTSDPRIDRRSPTEPHRR